MWAKGKYRYKSKMDPEANVHMNRKQNILPNLGGYWPVCRLKKLQMYYQRQKL